MFICNYWHEAFTLIVILLYCNHLPRCSGLTCPTTSGDKIAQLKCHLLNTSSSRLKDGEEIDRPFDVTLSMTIDRLEELDDKTGVLELDGVIDAEWTDKSLTWDPAKWGNIESVMLNANWLALPLIIQENGILQSEELLSPFRAGNQNTTSYAKVFYDGTVQATLYEDRPLTTNCELHLEGLPFDFQVNDDAA